LIFIWAILYLAYTSIFAKRLLSWNDNIPGHCFHPTVTPFLAHPAHDRVWVALWGAYAFISLGLAFGRGRGVFGRGRVATLAVLPVAAVQGPLHAYLSFTLRRNNETFLISGITEQQWGFGQIIAMILLGTNIIVLVNGIQGEFSCSLRS
jgi:hypothetical protein